MKIEVLTTAVQSDVVEKGLDADFIARRLWQAKDKNALLKDVGPDIRAIIGWTVDADLMDKCPRLEVIACPGVGYDGIDVEAAIKRKIRVTNTPGVLDDAVAECTLGLMIGLCRRLVPADRYVREGRWLNGNYEFTGELTGKTVGILGLGRIGKEIARRCLAMKMRVVYFGRKRQPHQPYIYYDKLEDMARDSDWLVVMAPGDRGTDKIVSRRVLEQLGPEGALINMARGSLVDEAALVEMLVSGQVGGAALDVFENEPNVPEALLKLDNVLLSPHQGSATHKTRNAMGQLVLDNLEAHFAGRPLLTPVA